MTQKDISYKIERFQEVNQSLPPLEMTPTELDDEIRIWLRGYLPGRTIEKLIRQPHVREFFSSLFEQYSQTDILNIEVKEELGNVIVTATLAKDETFCTYFPSTDGFAPHMECEISNQIYSRRTIEIDKNYITRLQRPPQKAAEAPQKAVPPPIPLVVVTQRPSLLFPRTPSGVPPPLYSEPPDASVKSELPAAPAKKKLSPFEQHLKDITEKANRRNVCGPDGCHCDEPPCVPCPLDNFRTGEKSEEAWWKNFQGSISALHDLDVMKDYIHNGLTPEELSLIHFYCEEERPNSSWQISYICNSVKVAGEVEQNRRFRNLEPLARSALQLQIKRPEPRFGKP